jgi:hypothetical protein
MMRLSTSINTAITKDTRTSKIKFTQVDLQTSVTQGGFQMAKALQILLLMWTLQINILVTLLSQEEIIEYHHLMQAAKSVNAVKGHLFTEESVL